MNELTLFWMQNLSVYGLFLNSNLFIFDDWHAIDTKLMEND